MSDIVLLISAIKQCMNDLGLSLSAHTHKVDVKFTNNSKFRVCNMVITFNCNWQSGDGPFVEVDDTIKDFGVTHSYFKL
jgi:hypothetical protein